MAPGWAERFAPFEGVAYLDAASQGPIPLAASRAGREALALKERPWRITETTYVSAVAEARALAARLLGAREESVALVTGAGQVVNVVARGLDLGEGDEIVLARHEFPSNDLPWRWLGRRGVTIRVVEPDHPCGAVSAERLAEAVGPRTRVVAFAHVSYLHGGRVDPGPVVDAARRFGRGHGRRREPGRGRAAVRLRRLGRRRLRRLAPTSSCSAPTAAGSASSRRRRSTGSRWAT